MIIAFFSNTLNHHQVSLCDELFALLGADFFFIETIGLDEERRKMGFTDFERPYKILSSSDYELTHKLALTADVAIIGSAAYEYLKVRILQGNKLTFSYSERWLKKGIKNLLSPVLLRQILLYLRKGKKAPWFMLSASAYLYQDLSLLNLFKDRCYKWGYFPKYSKPINLVKSENQDKIRILWVGRMIDWKHPELMIYLAEFLVDLGIEYEIKMIGDGLERTKLQSMTRKNHSIQNHFNFMGNLPNERVIREMEGCDIFCFTSDRQEGWGAVLGEAMSKGCCVVASQEAGSTPYLIKDGENGLIFQSGNICDFCEKIKFLIHNPEKRISISRKAIETIHDHWSAKIAAHNFVTLAKGKLSDSSFVPNFISEPCALES